MNEQLQTALARIINKSIDGIDSSVMFLSNEIPDVIHQLLVWNATVSALKCLAIVIFLLVWIFVVERKMYRYCKEEGSVEEYFTLFSFVRLVPAIIVFVNFNITWLQIWLAPKLYLIEFAKTLIPK